MPFLFCLERQADWTAWPGIGFVHLPQRLKARCIGSRFPGLKSGVYSRDSEFTENGSGLQAQFKVYLPARPTVDSPARYDDLIDDLI
jgi:hypothetical protein